MDLLPRVRRTIREHGLAGPATRVVVALSGGSDSVALAHLVHSLAERGELRASGLAAMHPRNGYIIRPLIYCRRADLRAHRDERQIPFVDDETNDDVSVPRNRVRAELLPLLETRFNPAIVDVLAGEAELARDEWAWMASAAEAFFAAHGDRQSPRPQVELDVAALLDAPRALRRLVVWRAMTDASGGRPVAFEHVHAALELLEPNRESAAVDAPGQRVQRIGSRLVLTNRSARTSATNFFHYPLSVPGEVRLAEAGLVVSAEPRDAAPTELAAGSADEAVAIVRSEACGPLLAVRNRRPGDRFRPLGLAGQKKLQDFFVDRKVARHERDDVPLVVDESDRIVWVAGHGIDEAFRVTDTSQAVVILKLRPA